MRTVVQIYLYLILLSFCQSEIVAQFSHFNQRANFSFNQIFPENEFRNVGFSGKDEISGEYYELSYLFQISYGIFIYESLELSLNASAGKYAGYDIRKDLYSTFIFPIDTRIRYYIIEDRTFQPYCYVGFGTLYYDVNNKHSLVSQEPVNTTGLAVHFPIGIGTEINISRKINFDLGAGGVYTTTHNLNYYNSARTDFSDSWFNIYFGISYRIEGGITDNDKDNLLRDDELKLNTDPDNPDTDGDGIDDGKEVNEFYSNPLLSDSDFDGLNDFEEVYKYLTSPQNPDSDNDELNDYEEVIKYLSDPNSTDTDQDGLSDYEEIIIHKTNSLKPDSDNDGISDYVECKNYFTNPKLVDSDKDGLTDFEEIFVTLTNPNKSDTDGGSVNDFEEIKNGSDPLNPDDDVIKLGYSFILEGITFEIGKAEIGDSSQIILKHVWSLLIKNPQLTFEIGGHTDNTGSKKVNDDLSLKRAKSVKEWLVERGIESGRLLVKGYGSEKPKFPNDSESNRHKNRRIEFTRTN